MFGATIKYHGEQHERYGGKLQWPGANGLPFLGDHAPLLKQHEIDALPIVGRAYERVFDLNDEEDRAYYNWVRDRIKNGLFIKDKCMERWPEDKLWPIVYLEWTQCYVQAPPKQMPIGGSPNGSQTQFTLRGDD